MNEFPNDAAIPKLEIEITDLCNNRCAFCTTGWINLENTKFSLMPRAEVRRRMQEGFERGARRVLFQGGEPTLHGELGSFVNDAYELGFPIVTVFTNARAAATDKGLEWLVAMNVSFWQVSIQGGVADMHDRSVVRRGAFRQTVEGVRRLIAQKQRVKVNGVLTSHLLDSISEFADLMIELRPEEVGFDSVKPNGSFSEGRACYGELVPAYGPYATALGDAVERMNRNGVPARLTNFPPCLAPRAARYVSEEPESTLNFSLETEQPFVKSEWKASLKVKAPSCPTCSYDAVCQGVYTGYAEAHGTSELVPLAERAGAMPSTALPPNALTQALGRALGAARLTPSELRRVGQVEHELEFTGPFGTLVVEVRPRDGRPAYHQTERLALAYRGQRALSAIEQRILRALVAILERATPALGALLTESPSGAAR